MPKPFPITPEQRALLENVTLKKILNEFIGFRLRGPTAADEQYQLLKQRAINSLQNIAEQKKAPAFIGKRDDSFERLSFKIVSIYKKLFPKSFPYIILERVGRRYWEAFIDEHDEDIGAGEGQTALIALQSLSARVEDFWEDKQSPVETP